MYEPEAIERIRRAREAWETLVGLQPALARASLIGGPGGSIPLRP